MNECPALFLILHGASLFKRFHPNVHPHSEMFGPTRASLRCRMKLWRKRFSTQWNVIGPSFLVLPKDAREKKRTLFRILFLYSEDTLSGKQSGLRAVVIPFGSFCSESGSISFPFTIPLSWASLTCCCLPHLRRPSEHGEEPSLPLSTENFILHSTLSPLEDGETDFSSRRSLPLSLCTFQAHSICDRPIPFDTFLLSF